MKFSELVWKRKSVRNFKPDDVSVDKIMKLLDAARAAPSGGNCQPWHFYVIKEAAVKKNIHESTGSRQHFILDAPVLIVVCAELARTSGRYGDRGRDLYSIQDTAAAIQNLLLCAVEEGLAACWCGAFDEKSVSATLKLRDSIRPVAVIPIGYTVNEPAKTSRRPLEEISTFIGFDGETIPQSEPLRVKFEHADLSGALFNDLNLENSEFVNVNMKDCSFADINLSSVVIADANLTDMNISNCLIDGFTVNGKLVSDLLEESSGRKI